MILQFFGLQPANMGIKINFWIILFFFILISGFCAADPMPPLDETDDSPHDEIRFYYIPYIEIPLVFEDEFLPEPEIPGVLKEPEEPIIPPIPEYIMGEGIIPEESLIAFLRYYNPMAEDFAEELPGIYIEEAIIEGINYDVCFAQMCLETGYLGFGGLVIPEMNNFCGLGAIGPEQRGDWFPDKRTGVRAHIQHLKAYASFEPINQELVDPRHIFVRTGSSPKISGLSGTWAADTGYADKISGILERLYRFAFLEKYDIEKIFMTEYVIKEEDIIDIIPEKELTEDVAEEVTE